MTQTKEKSQGYQFDEWYLQVMRIYRGVNQLTELYGLNYEQYLILKALEQDGATEVMKLADRLSVSNPAISRKVNVLYAKKLITKERKDESDQRKVFIALSEAGQQITRQMTIELESILRKYQTTFETDLAPLFKVTDQLSQFLNQQVKLIS